MKSPRTWRRPPMPATADAEHDHQHSMIKVAVQGFDAACDDHDTKRRRLAHDRVCALVRSHLVEMHDVDRSTVDEPGFELLLDQHHTAHQTPKEPRS